MYMMLITIIIDSKIEYINIRIDCDVPAVARNNRRNIVYKTNSKHVTTIPFRYIES